MPALLSSRLVNIFCQICTSMCVPLHFLTPPNWFVLQVTSWLAQSRTKDSMILLNSFVQEMFLRSPKSAGQLVFGITVTYSDFHCSGHKEVLTISLKTEVKGMAKKSANLVTRSGKMSPTTMDLGFRKRRIRPATSCSSKTGRSLGVVTGIWSKVSGSNSREIRLK